MNYVGIDPGASGAIGIIWVNSVVGETYEVQDWDRDVWQAVPRLTETTFIILEKVHSMPKQGVTSSFNFGMNFGWWHGALAALCHEFTEVTPQKWKKHFGLIGKDKEAARLLAIELFPEMGTLLKLKKHHNRAEALLLARYGKHMVEGGR